MDMNTYLGIDVGSVTTKLAALDENDKLVAGLYLPTGGTPVAMVQEGLRQMSRRRPSYRLLGRPVRYVG